MTGIAAAGGVGIEVHGAFLFGEGLTVGIITVVDGGVLVMNGSSTSGVGVRLDGAFGGFIIETTPVLALSLVVIGNSFEMVNSSLVSTMFGVVAPKCLLQDQMRNITGSPIYDSSLHAFSTGPFIIMSENATLNNVTMLNGNENFAVPANLEMVGNIYGTSLSAVNVTLDGSLIIDSLSVNVLSGTGSVVVQSNLHISAILNTGAIFIASNASLTISDIITPSTEGLNVTLVAQAITLSAASSNIGKLNLTAQSILVDSMSLQTQQVVLNAPMMTLHGNFNTGNIVSNVQTLMVNGNADLMQILQVTASGASVYFENGCFTGNADFSSRNLSLYVGPVEPRDAGSITFTQNVTFGPLNTWNIGFNESEDADKIVADGQLDLGGCKLNVFSYGGLPAVRNYTIVEALPVLGQFISGVSVYENHLLFDLDYQSASVVASFLGYFSTTTTSTTSTSTTSLTSSTSTTTSQSTTSSTSSQSTTSSTSSQSTTTSASSQSTTSSTSSQSTTSSASSQSTTSSTSSQSTTSSTSSQSTTSSTSSQSTTSSTSSQSTTSSTSSQSTTSSTSSQSMTSTTSTSFTPSSTTSTSTTSSQSTTSSTSTTSSQSTTSSTSASFSQASTSSTSMLTSQSLTSSTSTTSSQSTTLSTSSQSTTSSFSTTSESTSTLSTSSSSTSQTSTLSTTSTSSQSTNKSMSSQSTSSGSSTSLSTKSTSQSTSSTPSSSASNQATSSTMTSTIESTKFSPSTTETTVSGTETPIVYPTNNVVLQPPIAPSDLENAQATSSSTKTVISVVTLVGGAWTVAPVTTTVPNANLQTAQTMTSTGYPSSIAPTSTPIAYMASLNASDSIVGFQMNQVRVYELGTANQWILIDNGDQKTAAVDWKFVNQLSMSEDGLIGTWTMGVVPPLARLNFKNLFFEVVIRIFRGASPVKRAKFSPLNGQNRQAAVQELMDGFWGKPLDTSVFRNSVFKRDAESLVFADTSVGSPIDPRVSTSRTTSRTTSKLSTNRSSTKSSAKIPTTTVKATTTRGGLIVQVTETCAPGKTYANPRNCCCARNPTTRAAKTTTFTRTRAHSTVTVTSKRALAMTIAKVQDSPPLQRPGGQGVVDLLHLCGACPQKLAFGKTSYCCRRSTVTLFTRTVRKTSTLKINIATRTMFN
jgi:hypothetical protein